MRIKQENTLGELGSAIGKGLLAGLAGTAAITISQMIEMKITKREPSDAPVKVVSQVADIQPTDDEQKEKVSQEIHWAYGSALGISRGLIALTGLKGLPATALHFGVVWATALVVLPKYKAAPPITEEEPKSIAIDALHHAVYATAAGFTYDALDAGGRHERKFNRLVKQLRLKGVLNKLKHTI
ncbi:hypothetical protein [Mucilaginibacter sp. KACC 22063]|uniref:hypothetical protein n=1 Tax=Mucilaginibacter sp. KACC 22063 TaxID=3025666 RepID=UPI00236582A6|nr:hypothetical protein [Mucilaginibacter sp. KACC 22063]WDF53643.1 hypothetical protein PQ461_11875 [Mucilaginibacter sp. KACC 22063]